MTNAIENKTAKRGDLLNAMLVMAVNNHAGQFDRGRNPYILHCIAVMQNVQEMHPGTDEELLCIALGHDLPEDTKVTFAELREVGMTTRIIEGIRCLTKMPGESYEEYQEKVMSNYDSVIVKKADIRHNMDLRRLKGVTDKDIDRSAKYQRFYVKLDAKQAEYENTSK